MPIETHEFVDVRQRARELGLAEPGPLSLLPRNFAEAVSQEDLVYASSTSEVRKVWRSKGVEEHRVDPVDVALPLAQEDAIDWVGPVIFVAWNLLTEDPDAVDIALGAIEHYVTEFFRGIAGTNTVKLDVVVEDEPERRYRHLRYSGPPDGMRALPQIIREMRDGRDPQDN